jgi:amino acid transporter
VSDPPDRPGPPTRSASIHTGRGLRLIPLIGVIYCLSSAGPAGIEAMVPVSGPGLTFILLLILPVLYGLPLGLASGELNSRFPVEGGYYRWVKEVFGEFWGFQAGWWSWLGAFFDGALYAVWVAEYCDPFLPEAWVRPAHYIVPILVIAICLWINVRGIEVVGWSTMMFNIFLLSPFVILCIFGLTHWQHNPLLPLRPPGKGWLPALGVGALMGMWNYSGYESLSTAAEEIENPRRNYLRAILIAILISVPTYILPLAVGLAVTPDWTTINEGSFTDMGRIIGGPFLAMWIAAAAIVSNFALSNVNLLAYSRVPFTMAQDGFLPKGLTRMHRRFGTPSASLIATAVCYCLLTYMNVQQLTSIEMWLFSPLYALIFLALWRLRRRSSAVAGGEEGGYVIPLGRFGIWLVILPPMILMVMACWGSADEYLWSGGGAILSGFLLYPIARWWKRRYGAAHESAPQ